MSWRDELDGVIQEWIGATGPNRGDQWQRVALARSGSGPGQYVVDIRSTELTADQVDEMRLAGPEAVDVRNGFQVMDARFDGELLRVRVAEFAVLEQPYLWRLRREPGSPNQHEGRLVARWAAAVPRARRTSS